MAESTHSDWELLAFVCLVISIKLIEIDYLNPPINKIIFIGNLDYYPSQINEKEREVLIQLDFNVNMKFNIYYYYYLCFSNVLVFTDDIVNEQSIGDPLYE